MHEIAQQFQQRIQAATASRTPLRFRGGGTKDWYGQSLAGEILDTRAYAGVVSYEPTELVITARCGTPLAEVEALLAEQRQMLAFEPPRFGLESTIGGVVASALSGPRRASAGAVRDFVLGAVMMDGQGEALRFGGQVMKNVAGYDVSRLLAGSLGTLGLILEVSLKVLPMPLREATVRFAMDEITALRRLNEWGGQPLPISASCWYRGVLTVRLSGADAAVTAALRQLGGEQVGDAEAAAFWASLRDQTHEHFNGGALWRLSVPSAASALILKGEQLIEWGGAQRWLRLGAEAPAAELAASIRRTIAAADGHATLYRGGDKSVGVFHPLQPALARVHERLKTSFDPAGIFNPGRMY
jgi:glycolate oxidase FAD binding subunit